MSPPELKQFVRHRPLRDCLTCDQLESWSRAANVCQHGRRSRIKADEIAAQQAWALNRHLGQRERKLRVIDVKEMFLQMRDQVCANLAAR